MYFSIPLEQGLRHFYPNLLTCLQTYFSIPLEQGLRRFHAQRHLFHLLYFSIPLEQGLNSLYFISHSYDVSINIVSLLKKILYETETLL